MSLFPSNFVIPKTTKLYFLILSYALLLPTFTLKAQDLHASQLHLSPFQHSIARIGIFQGPWRATIAYRDQWSSVPVRYQSTFATAETKIMRRRGLATTAALRLQQDRAGDAALRWTHIGAALSMSKAMSAKQALSLGFEMAGIQRAVDFSQLTFKNQWTGDLFDGARPTGEQLQRSSEVTPTLSTGLNWHWEKNFAQRTRVDVGVGAFYLNKPYISLTDDNPVRLPRRWTGLLETAWQLREKVDAVGTLGWQQLGTHQVLLFNHGYKYWLSYNSTLRSALQATLGWRTGDALIPALQLEYNAWTVGLSYDVNISPFQVATNGRGGPELAIVYRPLQPMPVKTVKTCPIF